MTVELPTPCSRVECYLAVAAGMDGVTLPEKPLSRLEEFLAVIAGDTSVELPTPHSLTEMWLAYVAGVTPTEPLAIEGAHYIDNQKVDTRYLAVAAGVPGATLPAAPENRKEEYWVYISGNAPIHGVLKYATGISIALTDVVKGIEELQYVYGDTSQASNPAPDSPVSVDVVAGTQTVTITGKNLFDGILESGIINGVTGEDAPNANYVRAKDYIPVSELTNYTISSTNEGIDRFNIYEYKADFSYNLTTNKVVQKGGYWQTNADTCYVRFRPAYQSSDITMKFQVEKGTTPTAYEAYQGQNYTVNLGSIELCKIGTYQDYIYKSGDDWYIHRENAKIVLDGTEAGWAVSHNKEAYLSISDAKGNNTLTYSNLFTNNPNAVTETATWGEYRFGGTNKNLIFFMAVVENTDLAGFKAWLSSHNTIVYYQLATPTDTQIADDALIGQLNAVDNATLPRPIANLIVGATGTNLPSSIKISYYGESE